MNSKLICIVDDDLAHRKTLEFTLTSQNYQVLPFSSGADFLKHTFTTAPYALILDHNLSEVKTGLEYLKDIRKKVPGIPVVYMTSETDPVLIKEIKAAKVSGYIAKDPASLVRLRTLLDEIGEKSKGSWLNKLLKK
jgi:FixJ family two-component response regulator